MPTLPNRAALGAASAKNTGSAQIGTPDYAAIVKIIYMKNGASFTTLDEAKTLAAWKTKVASKPIFLTLTYDDAHLASPRLQYIDFQLFMKSLREFRVRNVTDPDLRKKFYIPMMVTGEVW